MALDQGVLPNLSILYPSLDTSINSNYQRNTNYVKLLSACDQLCIVSYISRNPVSLY